jgi:glyoxylase I family protein
MANRGAAGNPSQEKEITMAQIEHMAIYAADSTALKEFYVQALGLEVVLTNSDNPPGYFLADDRGTALEIIPRPAGESNVNQRWVCHVAFWVDDVATKQSELERLGMVFETETAVNNDSIKTSFFRDPEGNRCQIIWRQKPLSG